MRFSVPNFKEGFVNTPDTDKFPFPCDDMTISVDGVFIKEVFAFDTESRYVVVVARDADGNMMFNEAGDSVLTKYVYGKIKVFRAGKLIAATGTETCIGNRTDS